MNKGGFSTEALRQAITKAQDAGGTSRGPFIWMRVQQNKQARMHIVAFAKPRTVKWHTYFAKGGGEGGRNLYRKWICAGEGCPMCKDARVRTVTHVAVLVFNWNPGRQEDGAPYEGLQILSLFSGYWDSVITLAEQVPSLDGYDWIVSHNKAQPTYTLTPVPAWKTTQQLVDEGYIDMANVPDIDTHCAPNTIQALIDAQVELPGSPIAEPKRVPLRDALLFISPWKPWTGIPLWKVILMDTKPPDNGYINWAATRRAGSDMQGACLSIIENLGQVNDALQRLAAEGAADIPTFLAGSKAQRQGVSTFMPTPGVVAPTVAPGVQYVAVPEAPVSPPALPPALNMFAPTPSPPTSTTSMPTPASTPPPAIPPVTLLETRPAFPSVAPSSSPPPPAPTAPAPAPAIVPVPTPLFSPTPTPPVAVAPATITPPGDNVMSIVEKWRNMAASDVPKPAVVAAQDDTEKAVRSVRIRQALAQLAAAGQTLGTDQTLQMAFIQEVTGKSTDFTGLDIAGQDSIINALQLLIQASTPQ